MLIRSSSGVTIIELLVVVSVLGILIGLLFGPFDDLFKANTKGLESIIQTTDTRGALRMIERDITISSKFLPINTTDILTNTPYPAMGWNWQGVTSPNPNRRVLITENYATNSAGELVLDAACNQKLNISYVYFVTNDTLYRRTLKTMPNPTGGTNASGSCVPTTIAQKRTCYSRAVSATYCEASDAKIVSGVKNFIVRYYASSTSSVELTGPVGAKTTVLTLTTEARDKQEATASLRITRMNDS